jgi:ribonucrease Y
MEFAIGVIGLLIGVIAGAVGGFMMGAKRSSDEGKVAQEAAEKEAQLLVSAARTDAAGITKKAELEAKEALLAQQETGEKELRERRQELVKAEERFDARDTKIAQRESALDKRDQNADRRSSKLDTRDDEIAKKEQKFAARVAQISKKEERVEAVLQDAENRLSNVAGFTAEQAKEELFEQITGQAKIEAAKSVRKIEEEALADGDRRAKRVIGIAIQRYAGDYVTERTVKVVQLPSDDLKGRIIGREGRNIRAIEAATGVNLIIDDTPEAILISCFDPVRREVARITLEKLISDGRIHPSRVEEIVEKTRKEVDKRIAEAGQKAAFELGLHGIHKELLALVGRLRYRTSYGQNMWSHSIEVGFLCGLMASELGLKVKVARRAGLLHDIGKALTHEMEGSHALIGGDFCKKFGEDEIVVNAVAAHHDDVPQKSVYAHLVMAGDALSGARPGARREILESYVRRLEDLERISSGFDGVEKAYAIQAGREIRVMVAHQDVSDDQAFVLSKDIARKIEQEMTYPGQVKVCVIRETRAVDYAR